MRCNDNKLKLDIRSLDHVCLEARWRHLHARRMRTRTDQSRTYEHFYVRVAAYGIAHLVAMAVVLMAAALHSCL